MKNILLISVIASFAFLSCSKIEENYETITDKQKIALEAVLALNLPNKSNPEVFSEYINEIEVPIVSFENHNLLFPVLIDDGGNVKAILKQETDVNKQQNEIITYHHYANGVHIGSMVFKNDKLVDYYVAATLSPDKGPCEQQEGESCAGCHYRMMMEIIESDGDNSFLCASLGNLCTAAVYIAAVWHCFWHH